MLARAFPSWLSSAGLTPSPERVGEEVSQKLPRATSIWHFELYDGKMGLPLQELGVSGCDGD